jgi:amino acid transporter
LGTDATLFPLALGSVRAYAIGGIKARPNGASVAAKPEKINPVIVLVVCLCVVAMMFVGSIVISTMVVQAERTQPAADSSSTHP